MTNEQNDGHRVTYTIDELAAVSGVPSRTIRFYQAEEVLPWPEKRGRVAVYHDEHRQRLHAISVMQSRGLQLSAIRDLLSLDTPERLSVWQWLGLQAEAIEPVGEVPRELTEAELFDLLGPDRLDLVSDLEATGLIERLPSGDYRLPLPRLLDVTLEFHAVGVHVRTTSALGAIISKHLASAAEEILTFVRGRVGESFSDSTALSDLARTLEVVDRRAVDAVGLLWTDVMRTAVEDFRNSLAEVYGNPESTSAN